MVDATASVETTEKPRRGADVSPAVAIEVRPVSSTSFASYAGLCDRGAFAPAQSALWVKNWLAHMKPDAFIATLTSNGEAVFGLALEVVRLGPFRVARFMGGSHANGNFAPATHKWLSAANGDDIAALVKAIHRERPDLDALLLQRLAADLDGLANPLLALPHAASPNISLAVDLSNGFDAVLGKTSAKRKRKRQRARMRKFEAAGGYRRIIASTEGEARQLFDAFLAMKEDRFRKAGMANVFAGTQMRAFFHALFIDSLACDPPPFTLQALEVGGKLRAVTGTSRYGRRLICDFAGIWDDELAPQSPGEFLFHENIQEACEQAFDVYDFGVGDEPYKRLWCDLETRHIDAIVPLTAKGKLFAAGLRMSGRFKASIKNSPLAWTIAKTLRRRAAGKP